MVNKSKRTKATVNVNVIGFGLKDFKTFWFSNVENNKKKEIQNKKVLPIVIENLSLVLHEMQYTFNKENTIKWSQKSIISK